MVVVEEDKETEIPDKTTIILKKFSKDLPKEQEEFLNKDNFENHIYLCANDVAVKDISVKEHILPKNITIDGENNEKYKLLVLINDAEGYGFLNNHSNSERDDFNADEKLGNINFLPQKAPNNLYKKLKIHYLL